MYEVRAPYTTLSAKYVYLRYLQLRLQPAGCLAVCGTDFPRAIEPSTASNEENLQAALKNWVHCRLLCCL